MTTSRPHRGARAGAGAQAGAGTHRSFGLNVMSSIRNLTIGSFGTSMLNEQCMDPLPLMPPAGILMQASTCAQNWLPIGSISTTVREKCSASARSCSIIEPSVCVAAVAVEGGVGRHFALGGDEMCAPSSSELSMSELSTAAGAQQG